MGGGENEQTAISLETRGCWCGEGTGEQAVYRPEWVVASQGLDVAMHCTGVRHEMRLPFGSCLFILSRSLCRLADVSDVSKPRRMEGN
jgi:hypothetical protein